MSYTKGKVMIKYFEKKGSLIKRNESVNEQFKLVMYVLQLRDRRVLYEIS